MEKSIKVFAPATISNIGCGFDTMGFAIDEPGDIIVIKRNNLNKLRITKISGDGGKIPKVVEQNTATGALVPMLKSLDKGFGFDIEIRKKMPLCSGLGSSAASAVGAVVALNKLHNEPFNNEQLLEFALQGEKIASGAIHADNVAPCLYGGFIIAREYEPLDIVTVPAPKNLYCTVIYSEVKISTSEARKLIKKSLPLKKARRHFGNVGALVKGLMSNDIELIGKSIVDEISEPARRHLIPGYDDIKSAALNAGAVACNISGSGPSVFAFSNSKQKAEKIGLAMKKIVSSLKIKNKVYISKINAQGPKVLD